jgi:hypothetical protein
MTSVYQNHADTHSPDQPEIKGRDRHNMDSIGRFCDMVNFSAKYSTTDFNKLLLHYPQYDVGERVSLF